MCAGGTDGTSNRPALMAAEIVHDDEIAWAQRRHKELLDIGGEEPAIDRTIEDAGRLDPIAPQGGEEGERAPVAMRRRCAQSLSSRPPAVAAHHVGLGPGLVDEDEAAGVNSALVALPTRSPARDVAPGLLGWQQRFFEADP